MFYWVFLSSRRLCRAAASRSNSPAERHFLVPYIWCGWSCAAVAACPDKCHAPAIWGLGFRTLSTVVIIRAGLNARPRSEPRDTECSGTLYGRRTLQDECRESLRILRRRCGLDRRLRGSVRVPEDHEQLHNRFETIIRDRGMGTVVRFPDQLPPIAPILCAC